MTVRPHRTILLASDNLLAAWSAFAPTHDVLAVPEDDLTAALEIIRRHQPTVVVLEEVFALSARAAAFVTRLETHPHFHGVEIRVLTAEAVAALSSPHAAHTHGPASLATLAKPLPRHTSATRVRPAHPVQIVVNGHPAMLVNLSTSGTQVCSSSILRPQQRVRVSFPCDSGSIRTDGIVVWSVFQGTPAPMYRAGIKLMTILPLTVEEVLSRLASR